MREALAIDGFVIKNQVAVIYFFIKLILLHLRLDQFASHFVWNTGRWLKLGGRAGSRGGCFKNRGVWNTLANYADMSGPFHMNVGRNSLPIQKLIIYINMPPN